MTAKTKIQYSLRGWMDLQDEYDMSLYEVQFDNGGFVFVTRKSDKCLMAAYSGDIKVTYIS